MINKIANINIQEYPSVYHKMKNDLITFFNKHKKTGPKVIAYYKDTLKATYFLKYYPIDLYGWSGLQEWFNNLNKRKLSKDTLELFKNIYLDPTLCLRRIQDSQAKELVSDNFWNFRKNLNYMNQYQIDRINRKIKQPSKKLKNDENQMKLCLAIVPEWRAGGQYKQQDLLIIIEWNNNLKNMLQTLTHQFTHFLDHITGQVSEQNFEKLKDQLKKYVDINSVTCDQCNGTGEINGVTCNQCKGYGYRMKQHIYTPDNQHKKNTINTTDLIETEYAPVLSEILHHQMQQYISDCIFYFQQHDVFTPEMLLYFSYLFQYNFKNNNEITRLDIKDKLKELHEEKVLSCFEYLSNFNTHKQLKDDLNNMKKESPQSYSYTMKAIYNKFKNYYFVDTELSKKIL